MTRTLLTRALPAVLTVGLAAALWATLAPPQLGGQTMLATSYGSSMEPMVHRGDVLILRKGGPARVGDVVGYRSELLNRVVVHRVKRIENGKLVLKGDNNDFLDPERVPQSAVVGHLALHVPEAGVALEELRKPRSAAALGILAAFYIAGGSRKRRRRNPDETPVEGRAPATALLWHSHALWALGTVALLAAGIAVLGYSRAADADVRVPAYTETGVFSYTAPTSEDVYAGGAARTGDPVFVAATSGLDVVFGYQRSAGQLAGSVALVADVKSTTGWQRSFVVAPAQALRGDDMTIAGSLDLRRIRTVLDRLEARTGVIGAPYDVRVRAVVRLIGQMNGTDVHATWRPDYRFLLDATTMKPVEQQRATATRTQETTRTTAAEVALGPVSPRVKTLRTVGTVGLAIALLLLVLVAVAERRTRQPGENAAIARRLRRGMLDVDAIDVSEVVAVVELGSIDELVAVAEEYERLVLHEERGGDHAYSVLEDGTVYRYQVAA